MNERIYELIRLSAVPADQVEDYALSKGLVEPTEKLDVAKFAQLIVRECMGIAKQAENDKFDVAGSAEPEYRKGINDGRRNAAWGIRNRMKLHFGVEE